MPDRIAKVIARSGLCSRREAEQWIRDGRVEVDGKRIDSPALNVDSEQNVRVDGKAIPSIDAVRLWLYHKPQGLITTHSDPRGRPTIFKHLPNDMPRVVSVGRLDVNTEGLLLLTNDGAFAGKLAHPSMGWARTYRVRVKGEVTQDALDALKDGVEVSNKNGTVTRFGRIEATIENRGEGTNQWLRMTIYEGKYREIRRICQHLGLQVSRLIRTHYGPFTLEKIPRGKVIELAEAEFARYVEV